ncbi:YkyA family protein [Bacillus sp. SCS-151]|uniref:YkyA family protein n=1 Tax=Nanhaiella sioensis TaxID=3115293 RepID=UPI00397E2196
MYKQQKILGVLSMLVALLLGTAACSGTSPEEKIYNTLEEVVSLETDFEEQQEPLTELELKDKELFDQIISLSMDDFDQIVTLSNEALNVVAKREEHLKNEYESIEAGKKHFETILSITDSMKDEDLKKSATALFELMNERYTVYEDLHQRYVQSLSLDKELYEMLQIEDLPLEQLESHITKINESYTNVMDTNEKFNQLTNEFNESKLSFYNNAGFEIEHSDDSNVSE